MPPTRIPPLLQPYTSLPPRDSLTLLTSVLGASTNWLILRYLLGAFEDEREKGSDVKVVLVSFLRDWEFWRAEGRRSVGLDLSRLGAEGKFVFIDGLSGLFLKEEGEMATSRSIGAGPAPTSVQSARGLPSRPSAPAVPVARTTGLGYVRTITSPELAHVERTLQAALTSPTTEHTLLILDDPSILLSATQASVHAFLSSLLHIRAQASSTIISLPVDLSLVNIGTTPTPLESEHANLVVGLAHTAKRVVGLRLLDTGVARDVSGVATVARGGAWDDDDDDRPGERSRETMNEKSEEELLYYVGGDGGVKVFERGAGTDVG